uniref:Centromere/kinetochore protein zw10 N-terminal domain-containing protein n=1 Tax=Chrysemys picta bellii TaxID=8478 RepID=A0A8C3F8X1_CHRPI
MVGVTLPISTVSGCDGSGRLWPRGHGLGVSGEVCNMINKKYNEFLPSMQSAEDLVSQVDSLSGNIDLLKSRIENEVTQQRFHFICI